MARTDTLGNFLTDVAEAIRTKEGTTETIPASEFDTRIANLSGGGNVEETISSLSTLETKMVEATNQHIDYLFNDYVNGFATHTNEPVILYTPSQYNMYYMVRARDNAGNTWGIVWFPKRVLRLDSAGGSVAPAYIRTADFMQLSDKSKDSGFLSYYPESVDGYYSQNYSSLDECLRAIQDPATTYTKTNSGNWGTNMIDGYRVAYSNMPVADGTIYDRLYPGRKISSNETIEVISTE